MNNRAKRQRVSYESDESISQQWCSAKSAGNAAWKKQKKINELHVDISRKLHNEIDELSIPEHEKDVLFNIKKQAVLGDPKYIEAIRILNGLEQEEHKLNELNREKESAERTKISYDIDKNNSNIRKLGIQNKSLKLILKGQESEYVIDNVSTATTSINNGYTLHTE